jgi:hypothetical protein
LLDSGTKSDRINSRKQQNNLFDECEGNLKMKRLPGAFQVVGIVNICGAALLLCFGVTAIAAPPPKVPAAEAVTVGSVSLLTGLCLALGGLGLLSGPRTWRAARLLLLVLALVLLLDGLWFGWEMARTLLWPTDAQSSLAILFVPIAAAMVLWAGVLGFVGVRLGGHIGASEVAPNKLLQRTGPAIHGSSESSAGPA